MPFREARARYIYAYQFLGLRCFDDASNATVSVFKVVFEIEETHYSKHIEFAVIGRRSLQPVMEVTNVGGRPRADIRIPLGLRFRR